jgi:prepilin-type N-terminal cleavage/methylation domain-containing protein
MPISSVGKVNNGQRAGVTLIEMMVVVAIVALIAAISYPSAAAGIESARLVSATDSIAAFLNGAVNRVERRQQAIALTISVKENRLTLYSNEPGFTRELKLPDGISLQGGEEDRRLILMPGATVPAIAIEVANLRGARRIVRLDPMTGFPRVESVSKE